MNSFEKLWKVQKMGNRNHERSVVAIDHFRNFKGV